MSVARTWNCGSRCGIGRRCTPVRRSASRYLIRRSISSVVRIVNCRRGSSGRRTSRTPRGTARISWRGMFQDLFGLPCGRKQDSRPKVWAVGRVQSSLPNGRPRRTERRNHGKSPLKSGSLTRFHHTAPRGAGVPHQSSRSSADNQPGRLDHFQCSGNPPLGVVHRRHKGVEVRRLMEHRLAAVPAIQSVIDHAANSDSSSPWHPRVVADAIL